MNLLRRLAVILFAFLASAAAVIPVFLLLLLVAQSEPPVLGAEILPYAFVAFAALAVLTFVPAAAVIAVAEWRYIRHWLFFTTAGGLTAVLLLVLIGFIRFTQGLHRPDASISALIVVAGLAAGLVYWLIAGRTSGALRDAWPERRIVR